MHVSGGRRLERVLRLVDGQLRRTEPSMIVTKSTLPGRPTIVVLTGN